VPARDDGLSGDVALHGDAFATVSSYFLDDLVGAFFAGRIIDDDRCALCSKGPRNSRADAF
jgi:hypothetical protein